MRSSREILGALALAVAALTVAPTSPVAPALAATSVLAGDAVTVVQERRARQSGKKPQGVLHVALLKNTSSQHIRGLRVTVELYDSFGKLLWTKTVTPGPASLRPDETASLSVTTPDLDAYKRTAYRFDYRVEARPR